MDSFNLYSTTAMLQALTSLRKAPRFLQDTFFPNIIQSQNEEVLFDTLGDEQRLAPFVSPLVEGKVMTPRTFQTDRIKPAYVKPKYALDPNAPIRRQAGEAVGGSMTPAERKALLLAQGLMDQRDMITRRKEVMAAELLKTGMIVVAGEDYPSITLDFQRDEDLTETLTSGDRWGETGVSPYDDIEDWIALIGEKCGAAVDKISFGATAWKHFKGDPKTEKAIDNTLGQTGHVDLALLSSDAGTAIYKGRIGTVELWVYNDTYKADNGATTKLVDSEGVILSATQAAVGTQGHGAIIDDESEYAAVEYYPKSWVEKDPGRRMLMTQSSPILFCGRINATMYVKVR